MKQLQRERHLTYLFIAHDLSMVKYISDRIGVLHYGRMLEVGTADEVYNHPLHDYTKSLLSAVPVPDPEYERTRTQIDYDPKYEDGSKKRELVEIAPHHFVQASEDEIPMYRDRAKKMGLELV